MKIEKYKYLGNGKYKVTIDKEEFIIYEDIIIKYNLLSKDKIDKKELDKYLKDNSFYESYYLSLKYINTKMRTSKEIEKYLKKKEVDDKVIKEVIDKLKDDGYLNEDIYTKAYINDEINLRLSGPYKIKKDLIDLGISKEIIDKNIDIYTKDIVYEKIEKYVKKEIKLNKNKSSKMLKLKIINTLNSKGFSKEDILFILENISIDDKEIYDIEYKKIYDKLSKKYSGKELEYKVKQKMFQKGFC